MHDFSHLTARGRRPGRASCDCGRPGELAPTPAAAIPKPSGGRLVPGETVCAASPVTRFTPHSDEVQSRTDAADTPTHMRLCAESDRRALDPAGPAIAMNDPHTKPPDPRALMDAIKSMGTTLRQPQLTRISNETTRRRLAEIAGTDSEFVSELIERFVLAANAAVQDLQAAARRGDPRSLAHAARVLKEASDELHIRGLALLAFAMQTRAGFREPRDWSADVALIATELARVEIELRTFGSDASR